MGGGAWGGGGGGGAISSGEDRLFLNPHQTVPIVRSRYFLHENLGISPILYCRAAPAASCTFMYVLRKACRLQQPKTAAGKSPALYPYKLSINGHAGHGRDHGHDDTAVRVL